MTYSTNLDVDSVKSGFLIVMKPRRTFDNDDLVNIAADVFEIDWPFGKPVILIRGKNTVQFDFTEVFVSTPGIDEFFYNAITRKIEIGVTAANITDSIFVVTYEIYIGTVGLHFNRIPDDDTSDLVYFEPFVIIEPTLTRNIDSILFGFSPTNTTAMTVSNATHFWENHISESSFNRTDIDVYHFVGELKTANIKKIISALTGSLTFENETVLFSIFDQFDLIELIRAGRIYDRLSILGSQDPNFDGFPVREVFGLVRGFVPVNLAFIEEAPTTSDNRDWGAVDSITDLGSVTRTVDVGSTATTTVVTDINGIRIGDSIFFDRVAGTDESFHVISVSFGGKSFTHAPLAGGAMASGDSIVRSFIGNVQIIQDGRRFFARFGIDYTEAVDIGGSGVSGFSFATALESNIGMPRTLAARDEVICLVYGSTDLPTIGGSPFGTVDSAAPDVIGSTATLTNPVVIIYKLLRESGIPESDINTASFIALEATVGFTVGFAMPQNSRDKFQSYKQILLQMMQSALLRIALDNDGKWKITQLNPIVSTDFTVTDEELAPRANFSYFFDYEDMFSRFIVTGSPAERPFAARPGVASFSNFITDDNSDKAIFLHQVRKDQIYDSVLFRFLTEMRTLRNRLKFTLQDRKGILATSTDKRLFEADLDDKIDIQVPFMPGFVFDRDTLRSKLFSLLERGVNLKQVNVRLDDQKGIEDNAGDW